jgi:hypothetical protein
MSWPRRFTEEQTNKADAERLRDTFAAAALTGLMANSRHDKDTAEEVCRWSWNWADAMLRERNRAVAGCETATLTAEEREAIEWFSEVRKPLTRLTQSHNREKYKDTLCGLLERLK